MGRKKHIYRKCVVCRKFFEPGNGRVSSSITCSRRCSSIRFYHNDYYRQKPVITIKEE